MNNDINIKIITQEDLINSNCLDIPNAIKIAEDAMVKYYNDKIIFPDKTSVIFNKESQNRINCLPAAVIDEKVYGMKWVSVFPENPIKYKLQNLSAVILLSELEHGFPIAFMEGTMCSNLRTAAVGAIATKYLARQDSKIIGFIGSGEQAKTHLLTILNTNPTIKECRVSSISLDSEQTFIEQMSRFYPNIKFVSCKDNYESAVENADIIVTAISSQEPVLKAAWIKKGTLYCHIAGYEDEYAVAQKADKIICDDWNVVKHRTQTISRMYKEGLLKDEDIYANLYEIVNKLKKGRENDDEFIYFNAVGLSYVDIALANNMYKKVLDNNLGRDIILQSRNMFDIDTDKFIL